VFSERYASALFQNQTNGLVSPNKWEDPVENFFLRCDSRDPQTGATISLRSLRDDWYGQCWTLTPESDAMWRIYSAQHTGIRVSTTVGALFSSFWDADDDFSSLKYFIGKVSYLKQSDFHDFIENTSFSDLAFGGQAAPFARTLLMKREAFAHEAEVRLLFQDSSETKRGANGVAAFQIAANSVLKDVLLDPRLSQPDADALRDRLTQAGCKIPITQSTLYQPLDAVLRL